MRKRLSYANVMSTVAVFAALAGGAYAAAKIGTTDIQAKAVTSKKLARAAVTRVKLADRAVTSSKLAAPIDGAALGVGIINFDGSVRGWSGSLGQPVVSSPFQGEYELAWPAGAALDGDETQLATLASEQPGQIVARFVSGPGGKPVAKVFIYDAEDNPSEKSFNYAIYAGG